MDGNQRTTRWPRNISRAKLILALLCGMFSAAFANSTELPPEQVEALTEIEQALARNLKAGERMRQISYSEGFTSPEHRTLAILRAMRNGKIREKALDPIADGAVVGLSLAIEQDLGCGCCFEAVSTDIGDDVMVHVASLTDLRDLRLQRTAVTGDGLRCLLSLKHLQRLVLPNTDLTDDDLDVIAQLTSLEELSLSSANITDEGIRKLAALEHLRVLSFVGSAATGEGLDAFCDHPTLQVAEGGPRTRRALQAYLGVKSLARLGIRLDPKLEKDLSSSIQLARMPHLHSLSVHSETGMPIGISTLPSLQNLTLDGASLTAISETPKVTRLHIDSVASKAAIEAISKLPLVEYLTLVVRHGSDPKALSLLKEMEGLQSLEIIIEDPSVDAAASMQLPPMLRSLMLETTSIDLMQLSSLINANPQLHSIRLSRLKGVKGEALRIIELPQLKTFSLISTQVDEVELRSLAQLTELSFSGCRIGSLSLRSTPNIPLRTAIELITEQKIDGIRQVQIEDYRGNRVKLDSASRPVE